MLSNFLNLFLPKTGPYSVSEGDQLDILKAKSLQFVNFLSFILATSLVFLRSLVEQSFPPENVTTLYMIPFFALNIALLKFKGLFKTSVVLIILISYLAVTLRIYNSGGLSSANIILYMTFPLCSYVFLGDKKRVYIFYTLLCVFTFILFYLYLPFGLSGPVTTEKPIIKLYIAIAGFLISVGIIWINDLFKEEYHKRVKKLEKQNVGVKIISALNHELLNPVSILKGGFHILRTKQDERWMEKCENAIERIEEKINELNSIVKEYGMVDENFELKSMETIRKDLDN